MKLNKHQSPVDEYFRQREADIPVTYNPDDWAELAAALDAAAKLPPASAPPPPQARRFRGVKGWWVAGLFLLLLTSAWVAWEQGLPGRAAYTSPAATTSAPGATTGAAIEQAPAPVPAPAPVLEMPSKVPAPAPALPPANAPAAATAPDASPNEPEAALPMVDTLSTSVAPQDTIHAKPVKKKKKKNLFW